MQRPLVIPAPLAGAEQLIDRLANKTAGLEQHLDWAR